MVNQDQSTHTTADTSAHASVGPDLSKTIDKSLERLPGERVRSMRVFGDWYRCNWWTTPRSDWLGVAASRISRSQFLHVVLNGESLMVKPSNDVSASVLAVAEGS
jgi:hypothetical protein